MNRQEVYTDGSCRPVAQTHRMGTGGWAWCTPDGWYQSGYEKQTTSNRMEITAVHEALAYWQEPVVLYSDSQMVVRCFQDRRYYRWWEHEWTNPVTEQPIKNADLWKPLCDVFHARHDDVVIRWVKGHNGNRWNKWADLLANQARRGERAENNLPSTPGRPTR